MKITQVLVEAEGATVAFAFGRFNPAHQGHIEVWRAVEQAGANWFIGTNPSTIGPNDPLTFQQKSAWMEEIYPPIAGHIVPEQSVLTLAAYIFKKLRGNENATIAYITDETDWAWSGKLLNQYNGKEGAHGYYKFAQIIHVPSPRVSSATALRDAARADDKVAFYHASGTDPKAKVAGLTYFDTVKQACEKYPLPVKKAKKVKEQSVSEANPNQQFALWHPETKSYKGSRNKIPTSDYADEYDITKNYKQVDNFKHSEVVPNSNYNVSLGGNDDSIEKAEQNINRQQLAKLVKAAFNILTPEEKEVLNYRFWHDMTLNSVAKKMSLSDTEVRNIEAKAFRKLKKSSNLQPVGESTEQKTVAKTWDQMTPQEKISGVKGRTVWNEKTKKYYTVFDVPAKQVKEENIPYWTNLPESMSIDEKIAFFEQYHTKGNLLESNDIDTVEYFKTLVNDASTPIKNKSYIVVPLMLANNQLNLLDKKPQYLEFIGQGSKGLVFNSDDGEISYPPKRFNGISITHTFTFETEKDYDEFRTMIGLRFDLQLPKVNVIHNEASLATMRDYFAGDEEARDPYEITKQRLHFSKDKNKQPTMDKRFHSQAEYEDWLAQNKLKPITHGKGWTLINKNKA